MTGTFGKKVQERFEREVDDVEILRDELGEPTGIFRCMKCGHEWKEPTPVNIIYRQEHCPACHKEKQAQELMDKIKRFHPDSELELVGEYKGYHTKVEFHCNKCGSNFERKPRMIFEKNNACLCCGYKEKKLDHIKQKLAKHEHIEMLHEGEYANKETPMRFRCGLCGREWQEEPRAVIARKYPCGCKEERKLVGKEQCLSYDERLAMKHPAVRRVKKSKLDEISTFHCDDCGNEWEELTKLVIQRKYACHKCHPPKKQVRTHDDFTKKLQELHPELKVISEYKGKYEEIVVQCPEGHVEHTTPKKLYDRAAGCLECKRIQDEQNSWTTEKYIEAMSELHPEVEIIGELTSIKQPIAYRVRECGHERAARAYDLMKKKYIKCHQCMPLISYKEVLQRLNDKHPELEIVDIYENLHTPTFIKCHECGYVWEESIRQVLSRVGGCPACTVSRGGTSFVEQYIYWFFVALFGEDKVFNRKKIYGIEVDIFIPHLKTAIEPGSWYWHAEKYNADLKKKKLCEENGVKLITIYDSYNKRNGELPEKLPDSFITYDVPLGIDSYYDNLKQLVIRLYEQVTGETFDRIYDKWDNIKRQAYIGNKQISDDPWW